MLVFVTEIVQLY